MVSKSFGWVVKAGEEHSYEQVSLLLSADVEAGRLFWLERTPDMFMDGARPASVACNVWNKRNSGKEAFTACIGLGYKGGAIFYKSYKAHRVIWLLHYGRWPKYQIDHINGDKADNRILNLREVMHSQNMKNTSTPSTNSSGAIGVYWNKQKGVWRSKITCDRVSHHLGYYADFQAAVSARKEAERKFGFHENHGRNNI